ncbi:caspase-9 [Phasianus colchicus]|uniref:caspase-9 n=1 Tax=Phasianus colchicus TaxID=9054 RepID=UPI00129E5A3F|nr:caspase-9 [Phasianus colchicus]
MEEERRRALRRGRVRLVEGLRPEALWGPLQARGVFTSAMVEDMQSAGTRREQARQLVIDLETRGKQAFPIFLSILRDTGHGDLADMLDEGCGSPVSPPVDLRPVQLELPGERRDKSVSTAERLSIPVQAESQQFQMPPAPAHGSAVDKSDHRLVYQLRADPCGHCLIFNNVNFSRDSDLSARAGSDIDCEKLEKRFKSLCFHVRTLRNLKAQEIDLELRKLAQLDHSTLDCCLVVILSHGCQTSHIQFPGGIYGTDGKTIPIEKIVNYFNGSQCPSLRGKPKLFFIQACGGEQKDQGFEVGCESPQDETCRGSVESDAIPFQAPAGSVDEPDAVASLPTPGDILVSYSTFPGFVSWRDKVSGSWYVETLDSVLEHHARSEDLLTMLLRVSDIVSTKGKYKQIPGCFNFLRKKFFFLCK